MISELALVRAVPAALLALVFAIGSSARAQSVYVDPRQPVADPVLSLPYAFYNENFGFATEISLERWLVRLRRTAVSSSFGGST